MLDIEQRESSRHQIQRELDNEKTSAQRNELGQFSTPNGLAVEILRETLSLFPKRKKIRFLDPAFGTGVFFSALVLELGNSRIGKAQAFEIDPHYGIPSEALWGDSITIDLEDFTSREPPAAERHKFNLVVCNPPYVRHHHIAGSDKERLKNLAVDYAGASFSGLTGLYCYFVAICHGWLQKGALGVWLIPSEFMDVNYGSALKQYLLDKVTLLRIHRFDPNDTQFDDALVSSAVVWFLNDEAGADHEVKFTFGGSLDSPEVVRMVSRPTLAEEKKWTRFPLSESRNGRSGPVLGDYFSVKRGIATGDNKFFVMTPEQIEERKLPISQFIPILPSPRYLESDDLEADSNGNPLLDKRLFLLNCRLPLDVVRGQYPSLYDYLKAGEEGGVSEKYLCSSRKLWYLQEIREPCRFFCTYIGRSDAGRPSFRFILNNSSAIAANSYLMLYPKPEFTQLIMTDASLANNIAKELRAISNEALLEEGRVYGGGMHKLEPRELTNVGAPGIATLLDPYRQHLI
ncbi:MAG: Eco57I restriction-modification methylase domain-containing protein [Halieaceae bacterium]